MDKKYQFLPVIVLAGLIILTIPQPAMAYVDPSTATYIIQMVIGAILGATIFLRTQISTFFSRLFKKPPGKDEEKDQSG